MAKSHGRREERWSWFMQMRGGQPWSVNRARILRGTQTSAEEWLWSRLRGRRLKGLKFVRQAPVGPFFADFLCREYSVIVEIDGATHSTGVEIVKDHERTAYLSAHGYRVFRAYNEDIFQNLDSVLASLLAFVGSQVNDERES